MIEQIDKFLQVNSALIYYIAAAIGIVFRIYVEWQALNPRPKFDLGYLWNAVVGLAFTGGLSTIKFVGGEEVTWQAAAITGYYIGLGSTHMSRFVQRKIVEVNKRKDDGV